MPSGGVLTLPLGSLAANAIDHRHHRRDPHRRRGRPQRPITNNAVITGEYNSNPQNSASTTTTVDGRDGHRTSGVSRTPATAQVGQNLTYTVTATNNGPSNATGVVLTDTLPADIASTVTAMTSVPGVTATVAGGQVTASFGEVDLNDSVSLTITVVPTLAAVTDSPLVDTATVTNNEFDPNPNTAMSSVPVAPVSDLSITMSGAARLGRCRQQCDLHDHGDQQRAVDRPGRGRDGHAAGQRDLRSATGGATPSGGMLTLPLGSLAPMRRHVLDRRDPHRRGGRHGHRFDHEQRHHHRRRINTNLENSASVQTTVTAVTAIGLQITATSGPNYVDQDLKYTITATNSGPSNATGVVLDRYAAGRHQLERDGHHIGAGRECLVAGGQVTADFGALERRCVGHALRSRSCRL